jgi:hypothetical protein
MTLAQYYTIKTVSNNSQAYQSILIEEAKEFCQQQFSQLVKLNKLTPQQHQEIQHKLLDLFIEPNYDDQITKIPKQLILILLTFNSLIILIWSYHIFAQQMLAGLCLRCYVSHTVLLACQKLPHKYRNENLNIKELLPFVLHDNGTIPLSYLVDNSKNKAQFKLVNLSFKDQLKLIPTEQYLSLDICLKFEKQHNTKLENFAYKLTQQSSIVKQFLRENGIIPHSDWFLLCRSQYHHDFVGLAQSDRQIITVFQDIYRLNIQRQGQNGRYLPPNEQQLKKMLLILQTKYHFTNLNSPEKLLKTLTRIANIIRQYESFKHQKSPHQNMIKNQDSLGNNDDNFNPEIADPNYIDDISEQIWQEEKYHFYNFLNQKLESCLDEAIRKVWDQHLDYIKNGRYKPYYDLIIPALRAFYVHRKTQSEIVVDFGFNNRDQVLRIFNLTTNINRVKALTNTQLIKVLIQEIKNLELEISKDAKKLDQLITDIEEFTEAKVFQEALGEVRGTNRNSQYAKRLHIYLNYQTINL